MILVKYRMLLPNGYIETLNIQEAEAHGTFVTITEEILEEVSDANLT